LPDTFSLMRSSALPISHTTTAKEAVTLLRLGRILNFMKFLADTGTSHADASPVHAAEEQMDARTESGKKLLNMFLIDGKIRGQTPAGEIFQHNISLQVARGFIAKLKDIRVTGTR
ncbi:MAG: radical SAM protein, partial [Desulfobacterales bacterium]